MILSTTLSLAAAAMIVNLWHFVRIVRLRLRAKVIHGDGGHPLLAHRMRAHANFIENAPLTLILVAAIDLSGRGGQALAIAGAVYLLARVLHAFGMDRDRENLPRAIGVVGTLLVQTGLAAWAVLIALGQA